MHFAPAISPLLVAAYAAPPAPKPSTQVATVIDTLTVNPVPPEFSAVGLYQDLQWDFALGQAGVIGNVDGVVPQSPKNVAVAVNNLVDTTPNGTITIPSGSNVKSFDINYFYLGTALDDLTNEASVPVGSTVRVFGTHANGQTVLEQTFSFSFLETQAENAPMAYAAPVGLTNLKSVSFEVSVAQVPDNALVVLFLDSV